MFRTETKPQKRVEQPEIEGEGMSAERELMRSSSFNFLIFDQDRKFFFRCYSGPKNKA